MLRTKIRKFILLVVAIAHILACSVSFPVFAEAGPTVTIVKPSKEITVSVGYELILSAEATAGEGITIQKVQFFANESLFIGETAVPDTEGGNVYTITWPNMQYGVYNITAKAVDSEGNERESSPITITVNAYTKINLAICTFDNVSFTLDTNNPMGGDATNAYVKQDNYTIRRGAFTLVTPVDSPSQNDGTPKSGKSIRFTKNAGEETSTTYNGTMYYRGPKYKSYNSKSSSWPIGPKEKISLEGNFYFEQTNNTTFPFILKTSTEYVKLLWFSDNGFVKSNDIDIVPYEANKWYNVRLEIDMDTRYFDAYLNGVRIIKQSEFIANHGYWDARGIEEIYVQLNSPATDNANTTYVDDLSVSVYEVITSTSPMMEIISPSTDIVTVAEGGTVTFEAKVTDESNVIEKVEFWDGDTKLGEVPKAASQDGVYQYVWDNVSSWGIHHVTIKAVKETHPVLMSTVTVNVIPAEGGNKIYTLLTQNNENVYGTIVAYNNTGTAQPAEAIFACYDATGKLIKVQNQSISIPSAAGELSTFNLDVFSLGNENKDNTVKLFVWNDLEDMVPLTTVNQLR